VFLGSGSDNARQALVLAPVSFDLGGSIVELQIRTAGLSRVKAIIARGVAGPAFNAQLFGKTADDGWQPLDNVTVIAGATLVTVLSSDCVGFAIVRLKVDNGVGAAGVASLTLSATWT
jgi:hypothetical protein